MDCCRGIRKDQILAGSGTVGAVAGGRIAGNAYRVFRGKGWWWYEEPVDGRPFPKWEGWFKPGDHGSSWSIMLQCQFTISIRYLHLDNYWEKSEKSPVMSILSSILAQTQQRDRFIVDFRGKTKPMSMVTPEKPGDIPRYAQLYTICVSGSTNRGLDDIKGLPLTPTPSNLIYVAISSQEYIQAAAGVSCVNQSRFHPVSIPGTNTAIIHHLIGSFVSKRGAPAFHKEERRRIMILTGETDLSILTSESSFRKMLRCLGYPPLRAAEFVQK
ncbi:hypothetical protein C8R45DRAFT_927962 [Mycena sanguinolenta]|nr:hypothetical protein C8R45DRAFT_927962 [Mycena sanguinolenta]